MILRQIKYRKFYMNLWRYQTLTIEANNLADLLAFGNKVLKDDSIQLCVGMNDKNGVELYVGDKIAYDDNKQGVIAIQDGQMVVIADDRAILLNKLNRKTFERL